LGGARELQRDEGRGFTFGRAGTRAGELQLGAGSTEVWARGVYSLLWVPEKVLRRAGPDGSLRLARETVLRGAFRR